jgi:ribosomal protein S18 acetylase RimI-like enzyme
LVVREARLDEAEIVFRLMVEAFRQYDGQLNPPSGALRETVERTISIMESSGGAVLAWEDVLPVGSARYYYKDDYMYIGRVSVHPAHRGKGIGKQLVAFLEEHARQNGRFQTRLEVRLSLPTISSSTSGLAIRQWSSVTIPTTRTAGT